MSGFAFDTVLVANRGEIALRILRTVKRLGLRGLVLHHKEDRTAPALQVADGVIEIEGASPIAAFLDVRQIVERAQRAGAQAVHPGYGFLSENANFCRAVAEAGMAFIGPDADAIALMGDKVRARRFVAKRGFPVAPSAVEEDEPASFAVRARSLGMPLLIKPAAGGGGKGMRIVRTPEALDDELAAARREGERYFGDGRLYVERYIERPRHIEVQVLGDHFGNVVHLYERECSLQRRFQKVVEEAPAPALSENERTAICTAAVGIARAAAYRNAGTVEFIYGEEGFYFLEMNTRLQVEHPVTEAVTGIDLVAAQLRIASNEPLWFMQDDVRVRGHAVEARLYAEDADDGFAPRSGKVLLWRPPSEGNGVRLDTGISQGDTVTSVFDPLLAKVIVHCDTRGSAIARMEQVLHETVLLGCGHNGGFLQRLMALPEVRAGRLHTGLIAEAAERLRKPPLTDLLLRSVIAAVAMHSSELLGAADAVPVLHAAMGEWRN